MSEIKELTNSVNTLINKFDILINMLNSNAVVSPTPVKDCGYTLFSWLDTWYREYKIPELTKNGNKEIKNCSGLTQIEICIRLHIKGNTDDIQLSNMKALDIQQIVNKVKSSRMKKYTYDVLGMALKQAYKMDLITVDIFGKTDKVRHKRKIGKALTVIQQNKLIKIISGNKLELLYKFYLLTGCRKTEALNIKWTDINFKENTIHVKGTKTDSSDRYIPLFPETKKLLKNLPRLDLKVFPYNNDMVSSNFDRLKKENALSYRIHDLRHTFATRCVQSGISINTVQMWLGHSKASTTSDIYVHVQKDFEKKEVLKFNPKIIDVLEKITIENLENS